MSRKYLSSPRFIDRLDNQKPGCQTWLTFDWPWMPTVLTICSLAYIYSGLNLLSETLAKADFLGVIDVILRIPMVGRKLMIFDR